MGMPLFWIERPSSIVVLYEVFHTMQPPPAFATLPWCSAERLHATALLRPPPPCRAPREGGDGPVLAARRSNGRPAGTAGRCGRPGPARPGHIRRGGSPGGSVRR